MRHHVRVKDFQRKKFRNPLFPKKGKINSGLVWKIGIPAGLALIIAVFYILNSSSLFKITDLQISGNKLANTEDIRSVVNNYLSQRRFFIFNQDSLVFLSKSALKKELTEKFPIEEISINKNLLHTLAINIKEKDFSLMLQSGGQRYFIDQEGIAAKKVEDNEYVVQKVSADTQLIRPEAIAERMPVLTDESGQPAEIGAPAFSRDFVEFITSLNEQLKAETDVKVLSYSVKDRQATELTAKTSEGWQVMFNSKNDPAGQAKLLNMILTQKVTDRLKLKYIDLRFEGKVFYQ